jgi:hypothetical protein
MKYSFTPIVSIYFIWLFIAPLANAQSLVDKGVREFEELRLQQLKTIQSKSTITSFTTDGCSGGQSFNWQLLSKTIPGFEKEFGEKPPWEDCCVAHDKVYWQGSTVDGYIKRQHADEGLKQCVIDTGTQLAPQLSVKYSVSKEAIHQAFSTTAELMYQAVRLGGQPCSLLPWRWGYGWPNCAFASISNTSLIYSNIEPEEHITFFNTAAWLDQDNLHWNLPIHAWVYEPENSVVRKKLISEALDSIYELKETPENEANFRQRVNLLAADSEQGRNLIIRIAGHDFELPASDNNGHVYTVLKLPVDVVNAFSDNGYLHFIAVTNPEAHQHYEGEIQLVPFTGTSVISDIDDTIKITNVTDHEKLFDNTFYKDFREVSGMPDLYQKLAAQNVTIHFVSSSPWQLYDPLNDFVHRSGFPWATMNLKQIGFLDKSILNLFKKGTETKPKQIEPILQHYPDRRFILVGDNGEQDPEVYGDIARRYPAQIKYILIHNMDNSNAQNNRYMIAFKDVDKRKWQLFSGPNEILIKKLVSK